ncbi:glycosyltransferase family 4 protein [Halolamina rubra]|uniref:glycosyltransferase family 4 protein n=1 Tax=Halolamina rubra TaxID=1380430 RepID=UPI0009E1B8CA|nr:glycosyltransferase family 4 protein [Halolamina rubra]
MKIGFIHPSFPGDEGTGATHTANQIVDGLANRDHEITVYCAERPQITNYQSNINTEFLLEERIPHTNIALNRAVRRRLEEFEQYDLVSSYLTSLIPAMETVSEQTSAATLVTLNAYAGICPKNDLQYMDKTTCDNNSLSRCIPCIVKTSGGSQKHGRAYRTASRLGNYGLIKSVEPTELTIDGFHALSEHVRQTYLEFNFPSERITTIPNPIDESFILPHESDFSEPYKLLYVGYLEEHKGVEMLPNMMARLDEADHEFRLTIAGDGGLRSKLEQSVVERDFEDIVDFRGHVPYEELPSVYANHDLFVYPGLWEEPFGRVFLEAMGANTPIVATNVGAADKIVGRAGKVVEPTVSALSEEIISIVGHENLSVLSTKAQQEIKRYKPNRVQQEFEELYHSLVA